MTELNTNQAPESPEVGNQPQYAAMPPEILETISGLANTVHQLQSGMAQIAQHINAPAPVEEEEDEIAIDASKLEGMSRAELVNLVLGVVDKKIMSTAKQIDSKVTGLEQGVRTYGAQEDVRRAANSHADFWEWKDEMTELARDNPSLNAERLYKLAKAESPEKAGKVALKYKPAEPAPATKPKAYGGLFPSSATTAPSTGKMTSQQAADAAWEAAMADEDMAAVLSGHSK